MNVQRIIPPLNYRITINAKVM